MLNISELTVLQRSREMKIKSVLPNLQGTTEIENDCGE